MLRCADTAAEGLLDLYTRKHLRRNFCLHARTTYAAASISNLALVTLHGSIFNSVRRKNYVARAGAKLPDPECVYLEVQASDHRAPRRQI